MANDRNSWITPPWLIELAVGVLGPIDLDPMSSAQANKIVQARTYYYEHPEFDAYTLPWRCGTLWLNPPYGRGEIKRALGRFMLAWENREIEHAAIVLTNNIADTDYGRILLYECDAVCFPKRIAFIDPDTGEVAKGNDRSQMLTYFGPQAELFARLFRERCGPVLAPVMIGPTEWEVDDADV